MLFSLVFPLSLGRGAVSVHGPKWMSMSTNVSPDGWSVAVSVDIHVVKMVFFTPS